MTDRTSPETTGRVERAAWWVATACAAGGLALGLANCVGEPRTPMGGSLLADRVVFAAVCAVVLTALLARRRRPSLLMILGGGVVVALLPIVPLAVAQAFEELRRPWYESGSPGGVWTPILAALGLPAAAFALRVRATFRPDRWIAAATLPVAVLPFAILVWPGALRRFEELLYGSRPSDFGESLTWSVNAADTPETLALLALAGWAAFVVLGLARSLRLRFERAEPVGRLDRSGA